MSFQIGFVPNHMNEPINLGEKDLKCNNSILNYVWRGKWGYLNTRRILFRSSYQWRFHLDHKHKPRPPKSDFGETTQQQHRGLNQIFHKTIKKMLKNKRITR